MGQTSLTDLIVKPSGQSVEFLGTAVEEEGGRVVSVALGAHLARWPEGTTLAELTAHRDALRQRGLAVTFTVVFP